MSDKKVIPKELIDLYDELLKNYPDLKRKGKTSAYTSMNGHMFSFIAPEGFLALRLSKEDKKKYNESINSSDVIQYNSVMNGYVEITDEIFKDMDRVKVYFEQSLDFVRSLKLKPTKKKK